MIIDLSQSFFKGTSLAKAFLKKVNFQQSKLENAHFNDAQLQGAIFRTTQLRGVESSDSLSSIDFEERIKAGIEKAGDLQTLLFSGGLPQEEADKREKHLRKLIEECPSYLDEEEVKQFTKQMEEVIATYHQHSGKKAVHDLPEGAENIPYTQEQAEQWIIEYKEAMKDVEGEGND